MAMATIYLVRFDDPSFVQTSRPPRTRSKAHQSHSSADGPENIGPKLKVDDFSRDDGQLGTGPGGTWEARAGGWTIRNGQAQGEPRSPDELALATLTVAGINTRSAVRLPKPEAGTGLAFRVSSSQNYWLASVNPATANITVHRIENGTAVAVGTTAAAEVGPDMKLGVTAQAGQIEVTVNGTPVGRFEDPTPNGSGVGIGRAPGGSQGLTFDDFEYEVL